MSGVNKVLLLGRLGSDPEQRQMPNGNAVVNLSLATSEKWKNKDTGNQEEKTEWHRVTAFGKQAEVLAKYLHKGDQVYIEGKLQTRKYDKDGQTHYATDIILSSFAFVGGGKQGGTAQQPAQPETNENWDQDIPF